VHHLMVGLSHLHQRLAVMACPSVSR
jgi:hypothetical protein